MSETWREPDGLAMSSRNAYLDDQQRRQAVVLSRALTAARAAGGRGAAAALTAARSELGSAVGVDLDYLVITGPDLVPLPDDVAPGTEGRVLIAARLGGTRLLDNMPIILGNPER